jgi:hypothetical protein
MELERHAHPPKYDIAWQYDSRDKLDLDAQCMRTLAPRSSALDAVPLTASADGQFVRSAAATCYLANSKDILFRLEL